MNDVEIKVTTSGFHVDITKEGVIKGTSTNISDYARKFEQWERNKDTGSWSLLSEFYHFDPDGESCYFPRYDVEAFKEFLTGRGLTFVEVIVPPEKGVPVSFLMLPHIEYKSEIQKNAIEYLSKEEGATTRGLALQTGQGKLSPLYTKVRTPEGWTRNGDIKLYQKVVAPDGTLTTVTGIYPQGVVPIYRVRFEDGRFTDCGGDHLWKVNYVQWKDKWRVITTDQIAQYLTQPTYAIRMGVQLVKPEIKDDVALPLDPYVLGVILGDGNITNGTVSICKPDQFIKDELDRILYPLYETSPWHSDNKSYTIMARQGVPHMRYALEALGLWGKVHDTKFIPYDYLNASSNQRLSLVQGLMDTDGTVTLTPGRNKEDLVPGKGGVNEYSTTSSMLAKGLQELIRSLGGLCKLREKTPFFTYKGERREGKLAYILNIRYQNPKDLFRTPIKKEKACDNYQYADRLKLRIKSVEYIGDHEAQCIEVDHPDHLYITDDYIVTHNTVSYMWAIQKLGVRSMTTMTSRLEQWVKELTTKTTLEEDDIFVIAGVASLTKLFSQIDTLNPKLILASTKTIRRYIDYGPSYQHLPHPSTMCEKLGIGVVGTDEYHEHFFTNYLIGIVLNPALFIPITATFLASDPFTKEIFNKFIPQDVQFSGGAYKKYVNITAYSYNGSGQFVKPFHYMSPKGYSQQIFEKNLMGKLGKFRDRIVDEAIIPIVRDHYIRIAAPGEKFLFLCSSTKLCDYLVGVFKREFKDKTVTAFHSGMPSTILDRYDMIFSTPGSAGTGRDINNLRTCFAFESSFSEIRNLQFLGRLRDFPSVKNTPEFVYLQLRALPPHTNHAIKRSMLYGPRALTFKHRTL